MIRRACPVCSSRDESKVYAEENFDPGRLDAFSFSSRKIPEHMHYRLVVCPRCDLLYADPLPTRRDITKGYREAAYDSSEEAHYAARTYGRFLSAIARKVPGTRGALDIGTGDGAFLEELLQMGFTGIVGVEPSKASIQASRPQVRPFIQHGVFSARNFKKGSMSLVSCFQTFEHLYDPMKTCRDANQILREGGAFFAVFHNRNSLSAKILGMKSPIFDIEHLQLFSPQSARFMLERAGFVRINVKAILNVYPLHYWLKLLPLPRQFKTSVIGLLKKSGVGYLPITLPAGNMMVIGYKKIQ